MTDGRGLGNGCPGLVIPATGVLDGAPALRWGGMAGIQVF